MERNKHETIQARREFSCGSSIAERDLDCSPEAMSEKEGKAAMKAVKKEGEPSAPGKEFGERKFGKEMLETKMLGEEFGERNFGIEIWKTNWKMHVENMANTLWKKDFGKDILGKECWKRYLGKKCWERIFGKGIWEKKFCKKCFGECIF